MSDIYSSYLDVDSPLADLIKETEKTVHPYFKEIGEIVLINQAKVLKAFKEHQVSDYCFAGSSGYGYGDCGRQVLENVYSSVFGTEESLVRMQFVSGTHALAVCLFALLEPGETLLSAAGVPYDTLQKVIGIRDKKKGTLMDKGIKYKEANLNSRKRIDFNSLKENLKKEVKVVLLQRSRGYSWRPSVSLEEIGEVAKLIKGISPGTILFVDNCYGEFALDKEPTDLGVDLIAGSLIKNPGGGLAPMGGYAAGHKDLIDLIADRLTAPGLGKEVGATLEINRSLFQGFFLAPHMVGEALKSAIFAAFLFEKLGFEVSPGFNDTREFRESRSDIVQAIKFEDPELLLAFCRGIQANGPVDSFATPEPGYIAGYGEEIVMAAGTFHQGASLELSADAPYKPPYIAYLQGGLTFEHGKIGIIAAAKEVFNVLKRI